MSLYLYAPSIKNFSLYGKYVQPLHSLSLSYSFTLILSLFLSLPFSLSLSLFLSLSFSPSPSLPLFLSLFYYFTLKPSQSLPHSLTPFLISLLHPLFLSLSVLVPQIKRDRKRDEKTERDPLQHFYLSSDGIP